MTILEEPLKKTISLKNYIDGEWVESKGIYHNIVNPATQRILASVPTATKDEVLAAIEAAKKAFLSGDGCLLSQELDIFSG